MTPVVAISKPPIVAATTAIGTIIFDSGSCSPSFFLGLELGLGIFAVDGLFSVGDGCVDDSPWGSSGLGSNGFLGTSVVGFVSEKAVDSVSDMVVGCTPMDSEKNNMRHYTNCI